MAIYQLPDGRQFDIPDSVPRQQALIGLRNKFGSIQSENEIDSPTIDQEGFFERSAEELRKRGATLNDIVTARDKGEIGGLHAGYQKLGTELGALGDIVGEVVVSGARTIKDALPETIKKSLSIVGEGVKSFDATQAGMKALQSGIESWNQFKQEYPNAARDIESTVNIAAFLPFSKGAGKALSTAGEQATKRMAPTKFSPLFEDISEKGIDGVGAFKNLREQLGDEAAKLQTEISGTFDQSGKKIKPGLFDIAKDRGKNLYINKDVVSQLSNDFKQQAAEEIDDNATKIFQNAASRLDSLLNKNDLNLNDIESLRRTASRLSTSEGGVGYAGSSIKRQIDDWLTNSIDDSIIGDKAAIDIWKQAISKRREFGNKFERPKEIAFAISDEPTEAIEAKFLGSGPISSKKQLSRIYDDSLKALPANQREGAGFLLRQSIVNQMVKRAARTSDDAEGISASFMANQIRNLRRENPSLWNKFPDDEKILLNRLEKDLRKQTKGGPINKIGNTLVRLLGRATRSNLELPRTLKPKTIVTVEELIDLTKIKPKFKQKVIKE